jgi:hypothetical protein
VFRSRVGDWMHWSVTVAEQRGYSACAAGGGVDAIGAMVGAGAPAGGAAGAGIVEASGAGVGIVAVPSGAGAGAGIVLVPSGVGAGVGIAVPSGAGVGIGSPVGGVGAGIGSVAGGAAGSVGGVVDVCAIADVPMSSDAAKKRFFIGRLHPGDARGKRRGARHQCISARNVS